MGGILHRWEEMIKFLKQTVQKDTQVNQQNLLNG